MIDDERLRHLAGRGIIPKESWMTIPTVNLDDIASEQELRDLAYGWNTLAAYASQRAQMLHWQEKGEARHAKIAARILDERYNNIPKELRWK